MFNGFGEGPLFEVVEKKLVGCDPDCLEQVGSHLAAKLKLHVC
jgi:hypothetical protein